MLDWLVRGLLTTAALILALPAISDLVSWFSRVHLRKSEPQSSDPSVLFLVPAHDEELLIARTLDALQRMEMHVGAAEIVVVADNCSDRTAAIARDMGVRVLERQDDTLRGKPFGIAWALARVTLDRFDTVSIVDADCVVAPDFLRRITEVAELRDVIVQPFIDVSNASDSATTTLAALYGHANNGLAFTVKSNAGLNVPVGVGFAMGTNVLRRHGWNAFSICEDWELYAQMTIAGERIVRAPAAKISAQEARNLKQGATQRTRWQSGKLWVLTRYGQPLLASPKISWRQKLDAIAELTGLGPVVNGVLALAVAALALLHGGVFGVVVAVVASAAIVRLIVYSSLAVQYMPDRRAVAFALLYLPVYAASRVAIAFRSFVHSPGRRWVRAERHVDDL